MPQMGPAQSSTLFWSGSGGVSTNYNFTTVSTSTPASAGSEKVIAEYAVPYGTSVRFDAGRGFQAFLAANGGGQLTAGFFTLAVIRQDGSRKIITKIPLAGFDTSANQKDVQKQVNYQATVYGYGGLGEKVQIILDDGGTAFDGTESGTRVELSYSYKLGR